MKKTLKIFLPLLAVLAFGVMSFTIAGGGKHGTTKSNAKQTTAKESKAFTIQDYTYKGSNASGHPTSGDITTDGNWSSGSLSCDGAGSKLCGIEFDDANTTLDQALAIVANNWPVTVSGTVLTSGTQSVKVFLKS